MKVYKLIVKVAKFELHTAYRFSTTEGKLGPCGRIPPGLFRVNIMEALAKIKHQLIIEPYVNMKILFRQYHMGKRNP